MGILPEKYDRYIRFFKFILKYYKTDIFDEEYHELTDEELANYEWDHSPEELVADLKAMGPTYVKLGQLLSTRADMVPKPFVDALESLQDDVDEVPFSEIEQIFEEEIGQRISKAFESFDPDPIGSASIGQVHSAVLHSGKKVAVKVQRPGIEKRFMEDLDALMTISEKVESISEESKKFAIHDTIEELRYMLLQELNYKTEARNLKTLKTNMQEFEYLFVPSPIDSYCSEKVLTMEFVEGHKVTELSPFQLSGIPKEKIVNDFVKGYLKQIIVDGFAHADPHPGNIHMMKNGQLGLMDLGMVARFDQDMRTQILKLMIGLGEGDGDEVSRVLLEISKYDGKNTDIDGFKRNILRKIQENENRNADELQNGRTIMEINKMAAMKGVRLPVELSALGKILLNMDQIIAVLAPEYDFQKTIRTYMERLMRQHLLQELKAGDVLRNLLESKELMENLPYRLNKITDDLANQQFKLKMDVIDERRFILAFQKVANRITTGLVVAALILGAALIMRIPTKWSIFGYPGFAVILFVCAALIGFYLVYQILFKDEEENE